MSNLIIDKFSLFKKKFFSKKQSYSFGACDLLINYIFRLKRKGFYIDIGCQNPISNNNTYLLYTKGWRGMNIDLDDKNIRLFNLERPKDINICKCISSENTVKEFFFFHSGSPINSLEKRSIGNKTNYTIKKIKTHTLDSILENYNTELIDYFNLDVEGHELEVLRGFNIKKYKPKIVSVEFNDYQMSNLEFKNDNIERILQSEIYKYFISNDYYFINWIHSDLIFIHESYRD